MIHERACFKKILQQKPENKSEKGFFNQIFLPKK